MHGKPLTVRWGGLRDAWKLFGDMPDKIYFSFSTKKRRIQHPYRRKLLQETLLTFD
jgi:hypothetical protein